MELLYTGIIGVARTMFKVQGLDITVRGEHHFPAVGGAVVVINHTGYFDFVYAGLPARGHKRFIRYMAKHEVFEHPVAGPIMRELKHIPVDRTAGKASFDEAVDRICEQATRAGDSAALLVSHGTALRLWTSLRAAAGGGVDPLWVADRPMHNTGITIVDGDPGAGWSLTSWDDGAWDRAAS